MRNVIGAMVVTMLLSGCGHTPVMVKAVGMKGQQETYEKGKVTVVSLAPFSAVAAKAQEHPVDGAAFSVFLAISNLSNRAFNLDHSNITATSSSGIVVVPMSADDARAYIKSNEGPSGMDKFAATMAVIGGGLGAVSGNTSAVSQMNSRVDVLSKKEDIAAELARKAEAGYFSKTTILPGASADGMIMLELRNAAGEPLKQSSLLADELIRINIMAGADEHIVQLTFAPQKP